jgi:8-amino-7-oxononanoate synthase
LKAAAHRSLERRAAAFNGSEDALVFNSGYAANLGILSTLCGPGDAVFSDALNHASMIDGCRLARATTVVYPHCDTAALDRLLRETEARRKLVVTDAVFSMDGDRAPLGALVSLCEQHGAALLVDEAHAIGVLGPRGAGLCEELGLGDRVDLRMGTLGKALGAYGAFVACSAPLRELLFNRARSLVFSTSLPPLVCAAAERAIDLCESDGALRARLWRNIRRFAAGLTALGLPAQPSSAIFPVVLGEPEAALAASASLRAKGILAKAIRPPTVPPGTSRLRFALAAGHTDAQVDLALKALAELPS